MPVPAPTTPKDTPVNCQHGGPELPTPDLNPYSLTGGDGKNQIMFHKSRSGHLIALDDHGGEGCRSLRIQHMSGNAEIRMTKQRIEVKQKTGDINVTAEKEIRFDTTVFEVHTSKDISFSAGSNVTLTCGEMYTKSGKDTTFSAEKPITFISWNTAKAMAMKEILAVGKKQVSVGTKEKDQSYMALGEIVITSKKDLSFKSDQMVTITGLGGIDVKSNNKISLVASAIFTGMSMCININ